ncbi:hypothetical protein [Neorhizobium alkalisoli]|uniref:hypothetical protein n=1 Tax=Neorhizobium alkalisoli TaxID=528178 RepID=UPI0011A71790|nr:hypothetical protein [Neorhizobium alkalisoli]
MTKNKDLGSDAARSNPETADQDREALKKSAERNIERSKADGKDGNRDSVDDKQGQSTPGSEAAEPSPE